MTSARASSTGVGLGFALAAATSFGAAGALGRGLLDLGWDPGAVVLVRIWIAALVLLPFGLVAARGRWAVVRANLKILFWYGLIAVAGTQLFYFNAINHLDVGLALLIEYTAPVGVTAWLWWRYGVRPGRRTAWGAGWCALGLVLMLDVLSGGSVSLVGVLWSLAAMVGASTFFILSARSDTGLPPMVLSTLGLLAGAVSLTLAALIGLVPSAWNTQDVVFRGVSMPWWLPLVGLGVVTGAVAYTTGIMASRLLGSRLASFVALLEVVAAVFFAWLLVDQMPSPVQLFGGALVLAGVVLVKLGESPADVAAAQQEAVSARPVAG